ncbi:MAG: glycosyltransferase [Vicinamibacterales bacterium]
MRILFVSTDFAPVPPPTYGGIERVVAEVASGMARRGHSCALLAAEGSCLDGIEGHAWEPPRRVPRGLAHGLQVRETARRFRADLVHSFGETKWMLPWALTGGRGLISYGVLPQGRIRFVSAVLGDRVLMAGCSDYISREGRALVGGHWRTAYNCVDVAKYRMVPAVPADAPLVFLSRIDPIKGTHIAIDLAQRAGRRLVIAGNHVETGESGDYWRARVRPRLNGSTVEYVGPVNDAQKNAVLGAAAAILVPIQWDEPFGLVFIEALACGTPVISFARGALPEIVRHGVDGFLGNDPDDLFRAIGRIREIDRQVCRRRVEECFSTEQTLDRYELLYAELSGRQALRA